MSELFVYGIDENSQREAIAEFEQFGQVTELYSPRGRKAAILRIAASCTK